MLGKITAGRVLVIIGFILMLLTVVPLALALVLGAITTDATGYAFVPFLLLVLLGLPFILVGLIIAAVLGLIGLLLGGYRGLGVTTLVLSVIAAAGIFLWTVAVDAGVF